MTTSRLPPVGLKTAHSANSFTHVALQQLSSPRLRSSALSLVVSVRMLLPVSQEERRSSSSSSSSSRRSGGRASTAAGPRSSLAPAAVFRSCSALPEYLARVADYRQMDLDATFYQMVTLCAQPSKVYKSAYYRKQTKNRWARDDPAFAVIQLLFLLVRGPPVLCRTGVRVAADHPHSLYMEPIECDCGVGRDVPRDERIVSPLAALPRSCGRVARLWRALCNALLVASEPLPAPAHHVRRLVTVESGKRTTVVSLCLVVVVVSTWA